MRPLSGIRGFAVIWGGQFVSMIGSGMTGFALTIWAWEVTGRATALSLVAFFWVAPVVFLSPIAGALVDRWNRKLVMILSDLAAGLATIAILILHLAGHLQLWHLFAAAVFEGTFQSLQYPAYSAAISTMIPKRHYQRANGMAGMVWAGSAILAPMFAGSLLPFVGYRGIFSIDIVTFVVAIGLLLLVRIPQPEWVPPPSGKRSLWQESLDGFRFIFRTKGFVGLLVVTSCINFLMEFFTALVAPMVLARTNTNKLALGTVQTSFGVGGIVGGGILTAWGGPKRRVHGLLLGGMLTILVAAGTMGVGRSLPFWAVGAFFGTFFFQFAVAGSHAIWQAKVPLGMQGRVFANRRVISSLGEPLAKLSAGPLADYVFEPMMQSGAAGAQIFGPLVGTGSGAGMGLLMVIAAVLSVVVVGIGYLCASVRNIEDLVPDHDEVPKAGETSSD